MTPRTAVAAVAPWLIAAALVAAGAWSTRPVTPHGTDAAPTDFSAARALRHVEAIARAPHPMGSTEIERVRAYLVTVAEALDLQVDLQSVPARDFYGDGGPLDVVNVVAWIPGSANTRAVLFVGHYDTFPTTPGANDNSTAVATMLETARALRAGPRLANDVVFLFTDGEEPFHRFGANGFAAVPGLVDTLGLAVNLEAIGSDGASMLVETSGSQSWLVGGYAAATPAPAAFSFLTEITALIGTLGTDFDVFSHAGVAGMHFVYLRGSPIYHTMADDLDSVRLGSLQHHGDNALAIARRFGDLDLTTVPDPDTAVFFSLRPFFVRYATPWAVAFALLAVGLLAVALAGARRARGLRWGAVARFAAVSAGGALVSAALGAAAWMALASVRPTPGIVESSAYLAALVAAAALLARWLEARLAGPDAVARYGSVTLWTLLALLTAVALPGFSYLFVWPALAGVVALLWRPLEPASAVVRFAVVAAPTLLLTTPAVDTLWQFAQPRPGNPDSQMTAAAVVPLLLGVLAVTYLSGGWHRPDARSAPGSVPAGPGGR